MDKQKANGQYFYNSKRIIYISRIVDVRMCILSCGIT